MKTPFIILILILTIATGCKTQATNGLRLVDATKNSWAGGMPQSGSGNTYHILLSIATAQKYTINHVWIEGKEVDFSIQNYRMLLDRVAAKGDTIDIIYNQYFKENSTQLNLKENGLKPPLDGYAAILAYTKNNKMAYLKIKEIKVLPGVNYP
jgi:hypothetical protein